MHRSYHYSWLLTYAGRLTTQTVPGVLARSYSAYDPNGNLQTLADSLGADQAYGYDALDRLTQGTGPFGTGWGWAYDKNGNRTRTDEGNPVTLAYAPASNRPSRIGATDVLVDIAGNTLGRGAWTYAYTAHNRLKVATAASTQLTFAYNGLGQRLSRHCNDGTGGYFLYGPDGQLLAETDAGGTVLVEYLYLDGRLLALHHPDSDGDGLTNAAEARAGTNPPLADDDGDGLTNLEELYTWGTLIHSADSDGDGLTDGAEVAQGSARPTPPAPACPAT